MGIKRKSKARLGLSDESRIEELLQKGESKNSIARRVGTSTYQINAYLARKKTEEDSELLVKIRKSLKENGNFGKFNEETQEFIVELYREGIPSQIVAELIGLEHSYNLETANTGGFHEKKELTFKDECKQAQAEAKTRLIMAATTDPKPNDALRFLSANESTRNIYKAPKEEKGTIEIKFPGFSRESGISTSVDMDEKPEKLN
jgi:hypothetical protein